MQDAERLAGALVDRHGRDDLCRRELEDRDAEHVGEAARRQRLEDRARVGHGTVAHGPEVTGRLSCGAKREYHPAGKINGRRRIAVHISRTSDDRAAFPPPHP